MNDVYLPVSDGSLFSYLDTHSSAVALINWNVTLFEMIPAPSVESKFVAVDTIS